MYRHIGYIDMCSVTWVVPRTISYQRSSAAVVARFRALTNAYFTHARENVSWVGGNSHAWHTSKLEQGGHMHAPHVITFSLNQTYK